MSDLFQDIPQVAIQANRGVLIATIQGDMDERILRRFQHDLLVRIRDEAADRIVVDVSGVVVIDAREFGLLRMIIAMAGVLGARTVLSGVRPGVASALVDLDLDTAGLETCGDLDAALAALEPAAVAPAEDEERETLPGEAIDTHATRDTRAQDVEEG